MSKKPQVQILGEAANPLPSLAHGSMQKCHWTVRVVHNGRIGKFLVIARNIHALKPHEVLGLIYEAASWESLSSEDCCYIAEKMYNGKDWSNQSIVGQLLEFGRDTKRELDRIGLDIPQDYLAEKPEEEQKAQ